MAVRRIPASRLDSVEAWSLPSVAQGQVLKAESSRSGERMRSTSARAEAVPRPSLEQEVTANIRAGRYAAGVSAGQLESIVLEAAREGRGEGYAEGLESGRAEGFARGREEGLAAARRIIEDQAARLAALVEALQQPIAGQQEQLREAMLEIATRVAEGVVRTELRLQPDSILAVVDEALAALPAGASAIRVLLCPSDVELVLPSRSPDANWAVEADPALRPGDLRVETRESVVEYAVSDRLSQMLGQLLGAEAARERSA
jgi:flagellar assembly protein FliH